MRLTPAYVRRWLLPAVVLTAAAVAAVVVLLTRDSDDPFDQSAVHHLAVGPSWAEIAAEVPLRPGRHYSDEELGLYELIDNIVFYRSYFARARTADEAFEEWIGLRDYQRDEATGHERERLMFEFDVESALLRAYGSLPEDLGEGSRLEDEYYGWLVECLSPAGFPDVISDPDTGNDLPIYQAEDEELAFYESETGFFNDDFYDLRYECALRAAGYPSLDPDVRDEMIGRMKRHYLQSIYDGMCLGWLAEVPVVSADPEAVGDEPRGAARSPRECGIEWSKWFGTAAELKDPHEFTPRDLHEDPRAVRELSVARLLRLAGVLEFVSGYIANLPFDSLAGLAADEINRAFSVVLHDQAEAEYDGDAARRELSEFEHLVLSAAFAVSISGVLHEQPDPVVTHRLIDDLYSAFYDALDACGRSLGGPDMQMFRQGARGLVFDPAYDLETMERDLDRVPDLPHSMSYYGHLELLHECARHAAAYPALDPAVRGELIAPQRAIFAREILDRLDNADPPVRVPARYQAELADLRANGW